MKKLCVVGTIVTVLAFVAGWFTVSVSDSNATLMVDFQQIKQDAVRATESGRDLLDNARRLVEEIRED